MDQPHVYKIVIQGHLSARWSDWFDDLTIHNEPNGQTSLKGWIADQSALYGVLTKIHDLNLELVSVCRQPASKGRWP